MGLELQIKEGGSVVRKEQLEQLDLANIIATMYNHQENLKPTRTLTVPQAQAIIRDNEGQNQFFLFRVSNSHDHKRQLGLTINGAWSRDGFEAKEIILEKNDFIKGGLTKKRHRKSKSKNDSGDFDALIERLLAQDAALLAMESSASSAPGSPYIMVSSSEADLSSVVEEKDALVAKEKGELNPALSRSSSSEIIYEYEEIIEDVPSKVLASDLPQLSRRSIEAEDSVEGDLANAVAVTDREAKKVTFRARPDTPRSFLNESSSSSSEEEELLAKGAGVSGRGIGTSPLVLPKDSVKDKAVNVLSYLKWPAISSALTYGLVRGLHAAKLITATTIGTMAAIWAGVAFVVVGIFQAMRESIKKKSFSDLAGDKTPTSTLDNNLPKLSDNQWLAFKDGFESQKSMLNQFKACLRPNDYKNSASYYGGYRLRELDENYDLDAVQAKRAKPSI